MLRSVKLKLLDFSAVDGMSGPHNIIGGGSERGCSYCGELLVDLNRQRGDDGRLPLCVDHPPMKTKRRKFSQDSLPDDSFVLDVSSYILIFADSLIISQDSGGRESSIAQTQRSSLLPIQTHG
jgi:hypothetical protein